jgi:hypothetical protein
VTGQTFLSNVILLQIDPLRLHIYMEGQIDLNELTQFLVGSRLNSKAYKSCTILSVSQTITSDGTLMNEW